MNSNGILALATAAALVMPTPASGFGRPPEDWAKHTDTLARVLVAEADGSRADWAAILWVLEHRRGRSRSKSAARALNYSATLRKLNKRAAFIHTADASQSCTEACMRAARARQFLDAFDFVRDWLAGHVPDPCPAATHWRGIDDPKREDHEVVACGPTRNIFGRRL